MSTDPARGAELISVVIVDYNAGEALLACLASIHALVDVAVEVIVVANGAPPPIAPQDPGVRLILPGRNLGYAAGANSGIVASRGRWIALVNPDTILPPTSLRQLISFLQAHPRAATVSPLLRLPDGAGQPYGYGDEPSPRLLIRRALKRVLRQATVWDVPVSRRVDWVSGACLVLGRQLFDAIGPLDERYFMYFEDVDWCRRGRDAGWEIWIDSAVSVVHRGYLDHRDARRRQHYREGLKRYYAKHYSGVASACLRGLLAVS